MLTFHENLTVGQMFPQERKLIFDTIVTNSPEICVECGTWMGGGSTFFIANGLLQNKKGILYTWELDTKLYNSALNLYNNHPDLKKYIVFNNSDFLEGIKNIDKIDFALLDGPDDPDYTVLCFNTLNNKMPINSNIILHDWKITKCVKLKELLKNNVNWKIQHEILETETGMVHINKIK